jgi:hypothetical protein
LPFFLTTKAKKRNSSWKKERKKEKKSSGPSKRRIKREKERERKVHLDANLVNDFSNRFFQQILDADRSWSLQFHVIFHFNQQTQHHFFLLC